MKLLRDAEPRDLKRYAVLCGLLSLPFHYVFWISVVEIARDRPSLSITDGLIVIVLGLLAIVLSYVAFALCTFKTGREVLLPNPVLYVASVVLVANAIYQFNVRHIPAGVESLAVSFGVLWLARRRSNQK